MELQWPLIIFTTLVAWSAGLFGTQALMAVFGVGKRAQVPAWVVSAVLLAAGGIAAVGQLQLLQPFFGLGLSAALLHETVSPLMLAVTLGVVLCVVGSRKFARQRVGAGSGSRD